MQWLMKFSEIMKNPTIEENSNETEVVMNPEIISRYIENEYNDIESSDKNTRVEWIVGGWGGV